MPFSQIKRRQFLQNSGYFLTGLGLSACGSAVYSSQKTFRSFVGKQDKMKVYAWGSYFDRKVSEDFTKATNIKPIVDKYPDQETMLAKIEGGRGAGYSIVYPNDYMAKRAIDLGLVEPLDKSKLNVILDRSPKLLRSDFDPDNVYSVPYIWGTTGIIYNSKVLETAPTDWQSLWELKERLKNKIALLGDGREVIGMSLHTLGYSYNSNQKAEIEAAYRKLRELKPSVRVFTSHEWQKKLVEGELVLSMAYSDDALALSERYPNLKYVIPDRGTSLWNRRMVILKTAPAKEAAYKWLDFSLTAKNISNSIDPWEPSKEIFAKCERIQPLDKATQALFNDYWFRLKSI